MLVSSPTLQSIPPIGKKLFLQLVMSLTQRVSFSGGCLRNMMEFEDSGIL